MEIHNLKIDSSPKYSGGVDIYKEPFNHLL